MCLLFISFTVSPSSSQLLESNKKREELEKQLRESNEEKRLLLEEMAQLKQDVLAARAQGGRAREEALRTIQGTARGDDGRLVWPSSAGSLDGSVERVGAAWPSAAGIFSPWQRAGGRAGSVGGQQGVRLAGFLAEKD